MTQRVDKLMDRLLYASGLDDKDAVLVVQYDVERDQRVCRWSCDDRSIGWRVNEWPVSDRELDELTRVWREAKQESGSTAALIDKARLAGPETEWIIFTASTALPE